MRFLGFVRNDERWIASVQGEKAHPLAEINDFYEDVDRFLDSPFAEPAIPLSSLQQVPMIPQTSKILCVAVNYESHRTEAENKAPMPTTKYPIVFGRWASTLAVHGGSARVPRRELGLDWEGELAAIVGRQCHRVDEGAAEEAVLAYTCFNDLSARRHQSHQFTIGKNADSSGPIGPVAVTRDELGTAYDLKLETVVNGEIVQSASTSEMLFSIGDVIAYASDCMTINPGDVIATGTPEGVGVLRDPPMYLTDGDWVEVSIERIGSLRTRVVA